MAGGARLRRVCSLRGHDERVWCVAWRPGADPPQLTSCGSDRQIRLWGLRSGGAHDAADDWQLLAVADATERHGRTLRSLSWNLAGDVLAVASFDATVSLWQETLEDSGGDIGERLSCVGLVTGHENEVKSVAFSPSGDYMATCSRDKSVWIYETDANFEYECVALLQSHTQDVKMVRWHPTQDVLFSVSYDDTVKIWGPDGDDWSCKETLSCHQSTVWCISFDAVGSRFVTCSDDRTVRLWAPSDASAAAVAPAKAAASAGAVATGHLSSHVHQAHFVLPLFRVAASLAVSADTARPCAGRTPPADASCGWTAVAPVSDAQTRPIYSVDWLPFDVAGAAASVVASASGDNFVRVFQPRNEDSLTDWACVAEVEAHSGDANAVAWCPARPRGSGTAPTAAALLASAGDDGEVVLWAFAGA